MITRTPSRVTSLRQRHAHAASLLKLGKWAWMAYMHQSVNLRSNSKQSACSFLIHRIKQRSMLSGRGPSTSNRLPLMVTDYGTPESNSTYRRWRRFWPQMRVIAHVVVKLPTQSPSHHFRTIFRLRCPRRKTLLLASK